MGYGTSWITEWIAYSDRIRAALGLADNERIAGFIYIGTPAERPEERERPDLAAIVYALARLGLRSVVDRDDR